MPWLKETLWASCQLAGFFPWLFFPWIKSWQFNERKDNVWIKASVGSLPSMCQSNFTSCPSKTTQSSHNLNKWTIEDCRDRKRWGQGVASAYSQTFSPHQQASFWPGPTIWFLWMVSGKQIECDIFLIVIHEKRQDLHIARKPGNNWSRRPY